MADITLTAANVSISGAQSAIGIAGETIAAGQPLYIKASDGRLWKAAATSAAAAAVVGISMSGGAAGQPIPYTRQGVVTSQTDTYGAKGDAILVATAAGLLHSLDTDGPLAGGEFMTLLGFTTGTTTLLLDIRPNIQVI